MSFLSAQPSGKNVYIYEVTSFRNDDKKPSNTKISVGKISPQTFKPIYKDDFLQKINDGTSSITIKQFEEFNNRDFKPLFINNNIINPTNMILNSNINLPINSDSIYYNKNTSRYESEELFDSIKDYGTPQFFYNISNNIGLSDILREIFGDTLFEYILLIAIYLIISSKALIRCHKWIEEIDVSIANSLSSQRISDIFKNITYDQRNKFYKNWYIKSKNSENIYLDVTSLSTYSCNIKEAELGHDRDDEKTHQINLCLLFGQQSELPLYQTIFSGKLNDVSTISCILNELETLTKGHEYTIIMDKYFFSEANLNFMVKNKIGNGFLIEAPITNKLSLDLIEKHNLIAYNPENIILNSKETLYGITDEIKYDKNNDKLFVHIYYSPVKYEKAKQLLINDLNSLKKLFINDIKLNKTQKKDISTYFIVKNKSDEGISVNKYMFNEHLKQIGWHIFYSNTISNATIANKIFRQKDVVEKSFYRLKNKLSLKKLHIHSSDRMQNKLFILFISSILISYIHKKINNGKINFQYTLTDVFDKINLLKKININSIDIYRPITKEIKDLLDLCEVKIT
ncbi:MAG: transposase [Deltaproteobacteria bacterium]|jgi:transposase|nr:transposase [Deltaproteobacteria bacterium]